MDAVGASAKERHGAAVEAEKRRSPPAGCDIEGLVAPFRYLPLDDERIDNAIYGTADRLDVALGSQAHPVVGDGENLRKLSKRRGIVASQQSDAFVASKKRHRVRRIVTVAGGEMVAERHVNPRLRSARWAAHLGGQHHLDIGDLPQAGSDVIHQLAAEPPHLNVDSQLCRVRCRNSTVPTRWDETAFGEQLERTRHHAGFGVRVNGKTSSYGKIVVRNAGNKGRHELGPRLEERIARARTLVGFGVVIRRTVRPWMFSSA